MRRAILGIIAVSSFFPTHAAALSCGISSIEGLVEHSDHVFVAIVTSAEFHPAGHSSSGEGRVTAQFNVLELLKGDPSRVTNIQFDVKPEDSWPVQLYLGGMYLINADDGPKEFRPCSYLYKSRNKGEWCLLYKVRKYLGLPYEESAICESAAVTVEEQMRLKLEQMKTQETAATNTEK